MSLTDKCRDNHGTGRMLLTIACLIGVCCRGSWADEAVVQRNIGGVRYTLRLDFKDDFADLEQWLIESTGKVSVDNHWLFWDCFSSGKQAGTLWCKKRFSGPTVIEFDAVGAAGARNLNFILYATHPRGLLKTTKSRTGEYGQYHVFSNYIVTYLTPRDADDANAFSTTKWRIRFRKNPGFKLLNERYIETEQDADRQQHIIYVLDDDGQLKLIVDGELLHTYKDESSPYRSGHHGFRTWNSDVKYSNFKVYSILSQR